MTETLGELLVRIGIDTSPLEKGSARALTEIGDTFKPGQEWLEANDVRDFLEEMSRQFDLTPFAKGGIVMSPTAGLLGEAKPEAVLPLSKLDSLLEDRSDNSELLEAFERVERAIDGLPFVLGRAMKGYALTRV